MHYIVRKLAHTGDRGIRDDRPERRGESDHAPHHDEEARSPHAGAHGADGGYIYPKRFTSDDGVKELARKPVGTGAYRFVEWIKDDRLVMDANREWWGWAGKPPAIDRVIWKPIPEDFARLSALQGREVDVITNVPPDQMKIVPVLTVPAARTVTITINTSQPPLADKRVRQALHRRGTRSTRRAHGAVRRGHAHHARREALGRAVPGGRDLRREQARDVQAAHGLPPDRFGDDAGSLSGGRSRVSGPGGAAAGR